MISRYSFALSLADDSCSANASRWPGDLFPRMPISDASQFLICTECGQVQELEDDSVSYTLDRAVAKSGFEIDSQVVEISGRCADCKLGKRG